MAQVYLDHAATTHLRPDSRAALIAALDVLGNPASIHTDGQRARQLLEDSREQVAAAVGASGIEIIFTGGGTESVNLALKGLWWRRRPGTQRVLMVAGEHHATLDTVAWLAAHEGATVEVVPVDAVGRVRLEALDAALADAGSVALVTMLWASNEVGTVQPVRDVAARAARAGVPLHLDAVAAFGQLPIDVHAVRGDAGPGAGLVAMSVSAHKMGGPVGVGALWLDRSAALEPLLHGGGQQRGVRSGTQDIAAAAAFAAAARVVTGSVTGAGRAVAGTLAADAVHMSRLRDRLIAGGLAAVPSAVLSGDPDPAGRLPGNAHFSFPGCEGDSLLFLLDAAGIAVSTGSACQAGVPEPSHVLRAMGRSENDARGALRVTLGTSSTDGDVDAFLAALPAAHASAMVAGMTADTSRRTVPTTGFGRDGGDDGGARSFDVRAFGA